MGDLGSAQGEKVTRMAKKAISSYGTEGYGRQVMPKGTVDGEILQLHKTTLDWLTG